MLKMAYVKLLEDKRKICAMVSIVVKMDTIKVKKKGEEWGLLMGLLPSVSLSFHSWQAFAKNSLFKAVPLILQEIDTVQADELRVN